MSALDLTIPAYAGLGLIVMIAAALHRLGGQGFGTVTAPFAALLAPQHVPATVLALGVLVTVMGAGFEVKGLKLKEIGVAAAGRLAGTLPAVLFVGAVVGSPGLDLAVGLMILFAVSLSLAGLTVRRNGATLFVAGWLSGFIGTMTSVGAAPMGLIYQNDAARDARGTLNAFFLLGVTGSVLALAWAGLVTQVNLLAAAALAPFAILGFRAAGPFAKRTESLPLKPVALGLAALGAMILVLRSLA